MGLLELCVLFVQECKASLGSKVLLETPDPLVPLEGVDRWESLAVVEIPVGLGPLDLVASLVSLAP